MSNEGEEEVVAAAAVVVSEDEEAPAKGEDENNAPPPPVTADSSNGDAAVAAAEEDAVKEETAANEETSNGAPPPPPAPLPEIPCMSPRQQKLIQQGGDNAAQAQASLCRKKLVVLWSRQSMKRDVVANQEKMFEVLKQLHIPFFLVEGNDPANHKERNRLFALSGQPGQYPQFFIAQGQLTTFWGEFEQLEASHDNGTLIKDLDVFIPPPPQQSTMNCRIVPGRKVLVMWTSNKDDPVTLQHQKQCFDILKSKKVQYYMFQGDDPALVQKYKDLSELKQNPNGHSFPQFFTVDPDDTTAFFGEYHQFMRSTVRGTLLRDMGIAIDPPQHPQTPQGGAPRPAAGTAPQQRPPPPADPAVVPAALSTSPASTTTSLLVLWSETSMKRDVTAHQELAFRILTDSKIPFEKIQGDDIAQKEKRNKLFDISTKRGVYPQFFIVEKTAGGEADDESITFFGDWDTFQHSHECGTLVKDLGLTMAGDSNTTNNSPLDAGSSAAGAGAAVVPADDPPIVLVLWSNQSMKREVSANQEMAFTILKANDIQFRTVQGDNPMKKEQREELFEISGKRGVYPQFFLVHFPENDTDEPTTTFWGDWERFQTSNECRTLRTDMGIDVAVTPSPAAAAAETAPLAAAATEKSNASSSNDASPPVGDKEDTAVPEESQLPAETPKEDAATNEKKEEDPDQTTTN